MILFGEASLRKRIFEFVAHYHLERNHQGLGNRLIIAPQAEVRIQGGDPALQPVGRNVELLLPPGSLTDWEYTVMEVINQSAVIVMPAEPFLKWLHRADSTSAELTLADLRRDRTIYLLPPYDTEEGGSTQSSGGDVRGNLRSATRRMVPCTVLLARQPGFRHVQALV